MLRRPVIFVPALLIISLCQGSQAAAAEHTKDTLPQVQERIQQKKAVLVDVREQNEWDERHVEGAVLVPLSILQKRHADANYEQELSEKLPKDKTLYCHCRAGRRALLAADLLEKLGYEVKPLKPGIEELIKAGFKAVEKPAAAPSK